MNNAELKVILGTVKAVWPIFDISNEHTFRIWQNILSALTYEEVSLALQSLIADGREFPPTPGHILKRWRETKRQELTAAQAIDIVNQRLRLWRSPSGTIQNHPTRQEVQKLLHDHPVLCTTLLAVGVQRWRETAEENRAFVYRDFTRFYEELIESVRAAESRLISEKGTAALIAEIRQIEERKDYHLIDCQRAKYDLPPVNLVLCDSDV